MSNPHRAVCYIIPPYVLRALMKHGDEETKQTALSTLLTTSRLQGERSTRNQFGITAAAQGDGRRSIFDCKGNRFLAGAELVQVESGTPTSSDDSVKRAFLGFDETRRFYKEVFDRNSIDGQGMRLNGYVHFGQKYNNAFWDGEEMIFGDGDQLRFGDFTKSLDVIAHELTHGVTEKTAGLIYHNQPGALNESISDVFGSLVKQWSLGQDADQADWLIGTEVFSPDIGGDALRSMKAPGTAYKNNPLLGSDPQPDHMNKFVHLPDDDDNDHGGVHYNSGIPNKAFYLAATGIGGNAWEAPGQIWYESLKASTPNTEFQEFADTTYFKAGQIFGGGSHEQQAIKSAWKDVGIRISGVPAVVGRIRKEAHALTDDGDGYMSLARQVEAIGKQLKSLAREVKSLKQNV
jgi:Zn-dependent metalloprotease